ncbi:hypothetical protein AAY473_018258 [Plecturocebus cupreus]
MGFHYMGQAGLQLLTSSDSPALAFQSAGITDDLALLPRVEYSGTIIAHCSLTPTFQAKVIFTSSWDCRLMLNFVFLVEIVFRHTAKAGLELLRSSNLPVMASQSIGITDYAVTYLSFLYSTFVHSAPTNSSESTVKSLRGGQGTTSATTMPSATTETKTSSSPVSPVAMVLEQDVKVLLETPAAPSCCPTKELRLNCWWASCRKAQKNPRLGMTKSMSLNIMYTKTSSRAGIGHLSVLCTKGSNFGKGCGGVLSVLSVGSVEDALVVGFRLGDEADVRGAPAHGAAVPF